MLQASGEGPVPTELRLSADKTTLRISFMDGLDAEFPAELLRVESPSAEVQGHSPSERKLVPGKRLVTILSIEPVGNYAVRLVFSDGHHTGIYSWVYFHELARNKDDVWRAYLDRLQAASLSRDLV
ncbi:DUF971 domain-containing protein [Rhodomicrobium vannielii ATCC 17100]|uniref:gamma-butyrobetaine hydroxylase-like domain-containing protein n=1 Tax=Rhodomicrobium vannielii TaxID=1069 RepID=UPI00191A393D|nr:DUF971 domain-containing protein [Rhodomicrobium vannielii]MBJ7535546.1 DUF971 domain-containing protein [Rhodomicrobium vannielii ATCC 17100]